MPRVMMNTARGGRRPTLQFAPSVQNIQQQVPTGHTVQPSHADGQAARDHQVQNRVHVPVFTQGQNRPMRQENHGAVHNVLNGLRSDGISHWTAGSSSSLTPWEKFSSPSAQFSARPRLVNGANLNGANSSARIQKAAQPAALAVSTAATVAPSHKRSKVHVRVQAPSHKRSKVHVRVQVPHSEQSRRPDTALPNSGSRDIIDSRRSISVDSNPIRKFPLRARTKTPNGAGGTNGLPAQNKSNAQQNGQPLRRAAFPRHPIPKTQTLSPDSSLEARLNARERSPSRGFDLTRRETGDTSIAKDPSSPSVGRQPAPKRRRIGESATSRPDQNHQHLPQAIPHPQLPPPSFVVSRADQKRAPMPQVGSVRPLNVAQQDRRLTQGTANPAHRCPHLRGFKADEPEVQELNPPHLLCRFLQRDFAPSAWLAAVNQTDNRDALNGLHGGTVRKCDNTAAHKGSMDRGKVCLGCRVASQRHIERERPDLLDIILWPLCGNCSHTATTSPDVKWGCICTQKWHCPGCYERALEDLQVLTDAEAELRLSCEGIVCRCGIELSKGYAYQAWMQCAGCQGLRRGYWGDREEANVKRWVAKMRGQVWF